MNNPINGAKGVIRMLQTMSEKNIKLSQFLKRRGAKTGIVLGSAAGLGFFLNNFGGKRHINQDQENY